MRKKKLPIGRSDFKNVIEGNRYYVDKTLFIREIIDASADVILLPRPRRFGKTLNLSMLKYFFEISGENRATLFKNLAIADDSVFKIHQGKHPVIFLTFKDLKELSWTSMMRRISNLLRDEFLRHESVSKSGLLSETEKRFFNSVLRNESEPPDIADALRYLSAWLHRCNGQPAVILIDEYDTPIHAGYANGYYEEVVSFMRNLLSGGFKDNEHLFKGVLTGILRVARESIFSGLNNLGVYTLLNPKFSEAFGFTESEVKLILEDYSMEAAHDTASFWYNGYLFGNTVIYNPWSILNYVDAKGDAVPYWTNTADTGMIDNLVTRGGQEFRDELGQLLEDEPIVKPIYDNIVMRDLERHDDLLWSFLLFSGYLKAIDRIGEEQYKLTIPNNEVRLIYRKLIRNWFAVRIETNRIERMLKALTDGEVEDFEILLADMVERVLSYHDTKGPEPEQFYHAFVLGLLVWLEGEYEIKSNRESGLGRYDAALIPKDRGKPGIIMEFKKVDERRKETSEQALKKAMEQIEAKHYDVDLKAAGIKDILVIAIAFKGKELWVNSSRNEQ